MKEKNKETKKEAKKKYRKPEIMKHEPVSFVTTGTGGGGTYWY